jgi:hypothetical protein
VTEKIELKDEERKRCEIYTRVMGYHRPVSYFNIGKKQEYADRKVFKEPGAEILDTPLKEKTDGNTGLDQGKSGCECA